MDRRHFIRLTSGGTLAAAAAAMASGCSQPMPADAIAAWKGPCAEADDRRWILGYAILAPHSHNLQSWLVDLSVPDEICCAATSTVCCPRPILSRARS